MSDAADKLKAALLELPLAERLDIADFIYETLPAPSSGLVEGTPEFDAMLGRRLADIESGRVKAVPAEEVMERLRRKYGP